MPRPVKRSHFGTRTATWAFNTRALKGEPVRDSADERADKDRAIAAFLEKKKGAPQEAP